MRNNIVILLIMATVLISCCRRVDLPGSRYYAPSNFILGLESETMLWTEFATMDITPHGETADVVFSFKAKDVDHLFVVKDFIFEIPGISIERNGSVYSLNGEDIMGVVSYSILCYEDKTLIKKTGSINRKFNVKGFLNQKESMNSTVSFTTTILERPLALSLNNLTVDESKAEFGKPGYPEMSGGYMNTNRVFMNNSGHNVAIRYLVGTDLYNQTVTIEAGGTDRFIVAEEIDLPNSSFILTFDDGRVSIHPKSEKRFEYTGLPIEVKETPFLFFNSGLIYYFEDDHTCTYIITPDVYANAMIPEKEDTLN